MALPATRTTHSLASNGHEAEHSAAAAFEHLVTSAQSVINKRIDLALLEGRGVLGDTMRRAAWGTVGLALATVTWLSLTLSLVFLLLPAASPATRLGVFTLINGIAAAVTLAMATRSTRSLTRMSTDNHLAHSEDSQ